jgi:hypothetical protein
MPTYRVCYLKTVRSFCYCEIQAKDLDDAKRVAALTSRYDADFEDDPDTSRFDTELEPTDDIELIHEECEHCGERTDDDGECGACANCGVPLCLHGAAFTDAMRAIYDTPCDRWGKEPSP